MGYDESMRQQLARRNAERDASHLIPLLEPGMRMLDFGCGPGTISVGLAKSIEPGELHGVDMAESQIEMARVLANAGSHKNATFHVGDITNLPFEDGYFDVAHCCTVLMHVPDTQAALDEVKRVIKPGGLISCRETIYDSMFVSPESDGWDWAIKLVARRIEANGGHPQMGKELSENLHGAGFVEISPGASFEVMSSRSDIEFVTGSIGGVIFEPDAVARQIDLGHTTKEEVAEFKTVFEKWQTSPTAMAAPAWGWAIGRKP
jgi:ubiquinone/menaquinone biosynthesis C-methylase UbiE